MHEWKVQAKAILPVTVSANPVLGRTPGLVVPTRAPGCGFQTIVGGLRPRPYEGRASRERGNDLLS